jgi:hypothetical protein
MNNGNTNENFSIQAKLFIDEAVFVSVSSKIQLPYPLYLLFFVQLLLRKCVYCVAVCDVESFLYFMLLSCKKVCSLQWQTSGAPGDYEAEQGDL